MKSIIIRILAGILIIMTLFITACDQTVPSIENNGTSPSGTTRCEHNYTSKVTTEATCVKDGVKIFTCSVCNDSYTETIAAKHKFNNGTVTKEATYNSTGIKLLTCQICGLNKTETIPQKDITSNSYPARTYYVGVDLPVGEYILISDQKRGYYAIHSDANGNNIIDNSNFGYIAYVMAYEDTYLEIVGCVAIPYTEKLVFNPINNGYVTGHYKVGKDLPAGTYRLTAISGGYYSIHNNPHGNILTNDFFDQGTVYVTVKTGQYIILKSVKVEKIN